MICHYLALGKKVLVSAQHEAPLAVLQDQIPEALRPLTISLLTSERAGLKQLEQSVRKIAGEVNTLNEGELNREIQAESERIDRLHQQLASLDRELRQWASKQTAPTPFLDNKTLPEKLARYVIDQEESHRWFPDLLNGDEDTLPRFSEDDIEALRSARGELASDLIYLGKRLPKRDALPIPEDIVRLHRSLRELDTLNRQVFEIGNVPPLRKYTIEQFKLLEELRGLATKAHTVLQASTQHQWQRDARKLLSQTADTPLGQHLREWVKTVTVLEKKRQQFFGDALEIPVEAETHDAVHEAVNRLADGRRAFGWFGGDRDAKALVSAIRIGAAEPGSRDQWSRVREYLDTAKEAARLQIQWAQLRGEFEGPEIKGQGFAAIKPMADVARPLGNLWVYDTKIAGSLVQEAREVFADGIDFERLKDSMEELERLREAIDAHLKHSQLKAVNKTRQAMEETLKPCAGPIVDQDEGVSGYPAR